MKKGRLAPQGLGLDGHRTVERLDGDGTAGGVGIQRTAAAFDFDTAAAGLNGERAITICQIDWAAGSLAI